MLKHFIICVTLFGTLIALPKESPECLENPVQLDADFSLCCRGKPTFTSEKCVDEMMEKNYTLECMVDCMYKDWKFYNGSDINMADVQTFFEENVNEQDVRDLFINAFEECSQLELSELQLFPSAAVINDTLDCDLYSTYIDQCVWYHTLSHCPERLTGGDKDQCQEKIQWVKQCLIN